MARIDPPLSPAPVAGIAEPHQSTVAAILRAVALGVFTVAQADIMIDRVRAHLTALPVALPRPLRTVSLPRSAGSPRTFSTVLTGHSDNHVHGGSSATITCSRAEAGDFPEWTALDRHPASSPTQRDRAHGAG